MNSITSIPSSPVASATVSVRLARPHESPFLADLAARTFPLANPPGADPANIAEFIANNLLSEHFDKHLVNPNARIIVATMPLISDDSPSPSTQPSSSVADLRGAVEFEGVREQILGYSLIFGGTDGMPDDTYSVRHNPSVYLSKFYVDPAAHGGGIAQTLMREVREVARTQLLGRSLWLAVNHENSRAQRFYEKNGFERVGTKKMQVGEQTFADFVYETSL